MKRFIAVLLVAVLVILFAGCGKDDVEDNVTNSTTQDVDTSNGEGATVDNGSTDSEEGGFVSSDEYDGFFDKSDYTVTVHDPVVYANGSNTQTVYTLTERTVFEPLNSVMVDSTEVMFETMTVKEFIADGWTFTFADAGSYEVADHVYTYATVKNAQGEHATIYGINISGESQKFEDCIMMRVGIDFQGLERPVDFVYADEITSESTPIDVVNVLGQPQSVSITDYEENGEFSKSVMTIMYTDTYGGSLSSFSFVYDGVDTTIYSVRIGVR